jgi:hypothetical protein
VLGALRRSVPRERPAADWVHVRATDGNNMFESELVVKKEPHKGCKSTMETIVRVLHIRELGLAFGDVDGMKGGVHGCCRAPVEPINDHLPLHHRVHRRFENLHEQTNEFWESFVFHRIRMSSFHLVSDIF